MLKLLVLCLSAVLVASAAELPTRKYLNLAAIKTMVAAAENEAAKRNVQVTICIMDESGNLLFLQKADGAGLNTIQFAQKKAKYAAIYGRPSKVAEDTLKGGNLAVLVFPGRVSQSRRAADQDRRQSHRRNCVQRGGQRGG